MLAASNEEAKENVLKVTEKKRKRLKGVYGILEQKERTVWKEDE